ncbi:MAG: hypothetical protein LBD22_04845 [Spirochaetaceae bacterium]|jgi:hypothetical protein|nr:hypothetical protein [Spirochaetaceae bacterium]
MKLKHHVTLAALLVILLLTRACRANVLLDNPDANGYYASSFRMDEIFDKFWQGMNNNYVYWDVEPEGYWDEIYRTYLPKFDALGVIVPETSNNVEVAESTARTAYSYFAEIVAPLHDGHLVIEFARGWFASNSQPGPIMPSYANVKKRETAVNSSVFLSNWSGFLDSNFNFWKEVISTYIDQEGSSINVSFSGGDSSTVYLRAATGYRMHSQGGIIAYLYFNGFNIYDAVQRERTATATPVTNFMQKYFSFLNDPNLRGVIFDVRGNNGGANIDIPYIVGPLLQSDLLIAYTRVKKSLSPLDYKPWAPYYIPAAPASQRVQQPGIPVVVLCNDYSISCAELLVLVAKEMPSGCSVGYRTFGALGPRLSSTTPLYTNGGSFNGGPFWKNVIQAGFQTRGVDKSNYDGVGIQPEIVVEMSASDFRGGRDLQLEAALGIIDGKEN